MSAATTVRIAWRDHPGLGRAYVAVTCLAFALGVALLLGGQRRSGAQGFTTIREIGGVTVWGLILIGGGLALAAGAILGPRWARVALLAGALMHGMLFLWFFTAATSTDASFFGPIYSAVLCWWHVSQYAEYLPNTRAR